MSTDLTPIRRRVRYSDGGTFEVEVRTASDYLLTTTFLHFYLICTIIYAVTVWPGNNLNLDTVGSIVVWSAVLVSAFIVLLFGVWLNFMLVKKGILTYIYTTAILVPVVIISTFLGGSISQMFGSSFENDVDIFLKIALPNILMVVCFDIFHGRYVAPQHPTFIRSNSQPKTGPETVQKQQAKPRDLTTNDAPKLGKASLQPPPPEASEQETVSDLEPVLDQPTVSKEAKVVFGKDSFVATDILWIQSESHYLRLQLREKSYLVRAKLSAAVNGLLGEMGIQINRSVWVAFSAMDTCVEDAAGYLELRLTDKSTHRVSKSRKFVVKTKFDEAQKSKSKDVV